MKIKLLYTILWYPTEYCLISDYKIYRFKEKSILETICEILEKLYIQFNI